MTWDRVLYLVLFGIAMLGLWWLAKWGVGNWGWAFTVPMVALGLAIAWIIDRCSKQDPE